MQLLQFSSGDKMLKGCYRLGWNILARESSRFFLKSPNCPDFFLLVILYELFYRFIANVNVPKRVDENIL